MNAWHENLPDVSKWKPRESTAERLANLFFLRCQQVEERILLRAKAEKLGNPDNFDSGLGVEDIFRDELSNLLPTRYSVLCGSVGDRYGHTAGDCDVVVFNELWFPFIRAGATSTSRKFSFPIEGVYSVVEIKSLLDFNTLDDAMAKLVKCHRLHRPTTPGNRVVENRAVEGCPHSVANPLYTAIVAVGLAPNIDFESVINRFFAISKELKRQEVVRSLCVLGEGTVTWGIPGSTETKPALFFNDYENPIFPVYYSKNAIGSAFYPFVNDLLLNLYHCLLSPEGLQTKYGLIRPPVKIPKTPDTFLPRGTTPRVEDPENPQM